MFVLLRQLQGIRFRAGLPGRQGARSIAIRHVDAGSCNACEHELTATGGPDYDLQRHGIGIVASPRHADFLLVTGPVTARMVEPLRDAYAAMPEPRYVAALGDCALGCAILGSAEALGPALEEIVPVDVRIPGCPPEPAAIAEALLAATAARGARPRDEHR